MNLRASLKRNHQKGGVEITFSERPPEVVRHRLLAEKWRWSTTHRCWWKKHTDEVWDWARDLVAEVNGEEVSYAAAAAPAPSGPAAEVQGRAD